VTRRGSAWTAIALLGALLAAGAALAQRPAAKETPYALIFGTAYGPDDRPVYGARVHVRRIDGKKVRGGEDLVSDHQGEFALRVPAEKAEYTVRAELKYGKRKLAAETKVHVNFDERVDIGLHLNE
jgi:hypothetical protein